MQRIVFYAPYVQFLACFLYCSVFEVTAASDKNNLIGAVLILISTIS
jgi:hypothetical protein